MTRPRRAASGLALALLMLTPGAALSAGNVTAVNKSGSLVLTGDVDGNDVSVTPGPGEDELVVQGQNGTTVNSVLVPVTITEVRTNVHVDLEDGDDVLTIQDVDVANKLIVALGTGNDTFDFTDGSVARNVTLQGSTGDDEITFSTLEIGGTLVVKSEDDADTIQLDLVAVAKNTTLTSGDGDDEIAVTGSSLLLGKLKLTSDRGEDVVTLDDSGVGGKAKIALGGEDDEITVDSMTVDELAVFDGASGVDIYSDGGGNAFAVPPVIVRFELVI